MSTKTKKKRKGEREEETYLFSLGPRKIVETLQASYASNRLTPQPNPEVPFSL